MLFRSPWRPPPATPDEIRKDMARMARAGFPYDLIRDVLQPR